MPGLNAQVFQIPLEVTEHALTFLHPRDVASFSQTCQSAHTVVYCSPDQYLWRELFLSYFDDPRRSQGQIDDCSISYNWRHEVQRRVQAELIALNWKKREDEIGLALETFITVILEALPAPQPPHKAHQSKSLQWITRILRESKTLSEDDTRTVEGDDLQLSSRLRALFALSLPTEIDQGTAEHLAATRTKSRCLVYDLRNYRRDNDYGPFLRGGRINWVHVEAIVNVIQMNLDELPKLWRHIRPSVGLEKTRAYSAHGCDVRTPEDWAGVEGSWRRYVCFMDYRDLFAFNYSDQYGVTSGTRDPSFFEDAMFEEATRLIEWNIQLVPSATLRSSSVSLHPRKSSKSSKYPPLYFSGTSKGSQGNEAVVNGSVSMGSDGVVRWRFYQASIYDGQTQWSSEGIQLGNVGSASGVVGSWTGATHDHGDPVGPFWLWKVPSNYPSHIGNPHV